MFEDIEKYLADNRGGKKSRGSDSEHEEVDRRLSRALQNAIKNEFGGDAEIEEIGNGRGLAVKLPGSGGSHGGRQLKTAVEGLAKSIYILGETLKVKPLCMDAAQKVLKVGDMLRCPGGETKKVLQVGYGFCNLSRTDDHTVDDGVWFQNQINELNFIL